MKEQLLPLEGTINTRDLGGYPTKDGRVIAKKRLLRSDALYQLTENDLKYLKDEMDLKWIVDLRGTREKTQKPNRIPEGVNVLYLPLLRDHKLKYSQETDKATGLAGEFAATAQAMGGDVFGDFLHMYRSLSSDVFAIAQYRRFFDLLLTLDEGSILWHCAAGKDRTGFIAMQILAALGVDLDIIREDYLETNGFFVDAIQKLDDQLVAEGADDLLRNQMRIICSVYPEFFDAAMDGILSTWGDMDSFLRKGAGLTGNRQKKLRDMFLEQ